MKKEDDEVLVEKNPYLNRTMPANYARIWDEARNTILHADEKEPFLTRIDKIRIMSVREMSEKLYDFFGTDILSRIRKGSAEEEEIPREAAIEEIKCWLRK